MRAPRTSATVWYHGSPDCAADKQAGRQAQSSISAEENNAQNDGGPVRDSRSQTPRLKFNRLPIYRRSFMPDWHNGRA
jgi:hypothetical protein